ncbi:zinc finger protein 2 homolog [Drosophila novamexicana]|uniref:zinc finger protein 2 homolog n=1 Tax=Drosophila novamexicana TaxID=47314 RepID=UPI0011E58CAF|nr:zinc finger protein 2 homolog [Drosophila novamexicana]
MEEACRICTSNCVSLVNIFDQLEQDPPLADMLKECGNCKISPNDPLPQNICLACILDAQNAFQFKRRCEQSQQYFWLLLETENKKNSEWVKDVPPSQCSLEIKTENMENMPQENIVDNESFEYNGLSAADEFLVVEHQGYSDCENVPISQCFRDVKEDPLESILPDHRRISSEASLCDQQDNIDDKQNSYSCLKCGKVFSNKKDLTKHSRVHIGRYKCTYCSKAFNSSSTCKLHVRLHTGERPFKCKYCTEAFLRKDDLQRHIFTHTGERPYECDQCLKRFTHRSILNKHIRIHTNERKHKCPHCQKAFRDGYNLKVHIRRCTGERPFQCAECPKAFALNKELQLHQKTHMDDKSPGCRKPVSTKRKTIAGKAPKKNSTHTKSRLSLDLAQSNLSIEMPKADDSSEERNSRILSIDAPASGILSIELSEDATNEEGIEGRISNGIRTSSQKSFQCTTCDKSFATRSRLNRHYSVHTSERPFQCELCLKSFKQNVSLIRHSVIHTRKHRST